MIFRKKWAVTLYMCVSLNIILIFSEDNYPTDVGENLEYNFQETSQGYCANENFISLIHSIKKCGVESFKNSYTESNELSIKPTPTCVTECIAAEDYIESTTFQVYVTTPTVTITQNPKTKFTDTRRLTIIQPIIKTTPPDPITSTQICANSTPTLISTVVPTIAASPVTEHTGIIESKHTSDCTVTTIDITKTIPLYFITTTAIDGSFEQRNTFVVVDSVTPSSPSNISATAVV
ncbi:uncharacterized protein LOC108909075 [Anoplophora glabripennis]|uniref:uncharacterized protein LOC108909075 n=1 Tax=Anoplophora glabripennis TaxID=217634 RepID=UPI0008740CFD|nr:uncharacterized protein LOC108909075 [Anoplophora glabripennis]